MFIMHPHNPGHVSTGITRIIHPLDNKCHKFLKNSPIWLRIMVVPGRYILKP